MDSWALSSYRRAADAWQRGAFDLEEAPLRVKNPRAPQAMLGSEGQQSMEKRSLIVSAPQRSQVDEEYSRTKVEEIATAPPIFQARAQEDGSITAANASSLNDGAAALVLLSEHRAKSMGITPLARIVSFADCAVDPWHVCKAPQAAATKALQAARMSSAHFYEVAVANMQLLDLDPSTLGRRHWWASDGHRWARVNVNGGAVALGHPLGASGARILTTLLSVLTQQAGLEEVMVNQWGLKG
eukprot:Skav208206  [mRNA]  locus=scaffold2026:279528:285116:+ [translate_table: standard]